MSIDLQTLVDRLCKAVALADELDSAALDAMRGHLLELKTGAAESDLECLESACDMGIEVVGEMLIEGVDSPCGLGTLAEVAGYASQVLEALDLEMPVDSVPPPIRGGVVAEIGSDPSKPCEPQGEADPELITMFVGSATDNLADLEENLLGLEAMKDPEQREEALAQIKRSLHTFKGECGVIPLPKAQVLCHEAESLFDRFQELETPLPTELLLALGDWLTGYVDQLSGGDLVTVPEHAELLSQLRASSPDPGSDTDPIFDMDMAEEGDFGLGAPKLALNLVDDGIRIEFPSEILEDEVLPDFIGEAREHLEISEAVLLDLEKTPDDMELINTIFRAFHTIKGVAGFLNLEPMVKLAHTAETLMDQLRKGEVICEEIHLDVIFTSCDVMNGLVAALEGDKGPTVLEHANLIERLGTIISGGEVSGSSGGSTEKTAHLQETLGADDAEDPMADGVQAPQLCRRLGEILVSQGLISERAADVMLERQKTVKGKRLGQMLIDSGLLSQADVDRALAIQVLEQVDSGAAGSGLISAVAEVPATTASPVASQPKTITPPKQAATAKKAPARKPRISSTIKVNTGRLDSLVDLVGELVIAQQMVYQDPDLESIVSERLTRNISQVGKITRDLHEAAMSLRMVTLKPTFQKMARLVRDVSAKAGKEVKLVMTGEDTELDRNVVEEISDPMVHLIRNGIDHGLEGPEERIAAGKAREGVLELKAYHQGGAIVIEIIDNGRGLNRAKILEKATEKGLIPADTILEEIPDAQVWAMIFQAGFSTTDVVSDISGRGVGMDVVRRNIEKMRGKVEIVSTPGKGSVFSLRLPLTLAIIDGMIVRVGDQRYILPTLAIEQSFRAEESQLHQVMNEGEVVKVRGMLLPIHRLKTLFDQADGLDNPIDGILIVLEDNGQRCCLMVDEILGQQQVVIKGLGEAAQQVRGVSGGAILGDGRIALIVDVDTLVKGVNQAVA